MNLDRKAIVAIALSVAFLLLYRPILKWAGLSHFVEPQRPVATSNEAVRETSRTAEAPVTRLPSTAIATGSAPKMADESTLRSMSARPVVATVEKTLSIETPLYHATFSTTGARLVSLELKRFASAHGVSSASGKKVPIHRDGEVPPGDRVVLAGGPLFALDLGSGTNRVSLADFPYAVSDSQDASGQVRMLSFVAQDSTGLYVRQTYRVRPEDYALDYEVELRNVPDALRVSDYSLTTRSWPILTEKDLTADLHAVRASSLVGTNLHRENAGSLIKKPRAFEGNAAWAAVHSRYFLSAIVVAEGTSRSTIGTGSRRALTPDELKQMKPGSANEQEVAENSLVMGIPSNSHPVNRFVLYMGPADYFRLAALKVHLERAVDMGWVWIVPFSSMLLKLLNLIYGVVQNYGVAILALATLVRVLLHPLNMMSMKSMRELQKLQPEIERMKVKYKNDAAAMNTGMMALYKEHKVNPAGGCLPMLLQMPLFVALYQVLYNAIDLRRAPFVGWMDDLSAPDLLFNVAGFPIRLLPILMLGSGLLSQLLTPTDPRQKPTMYMMNVMMLVFFYNLPSGLVLYWTIMNLLTALQQWMVLRSDGPTQLTVPVPVPVKGGGGRRKAASGR